MALNRTSQAEWRGTLKGGTGEFTVGEGVFSGSYTYASRFEEGDGTNPEELIAAAHAACYSMALSGILGRNDHEPDSVQTQATVTLDPNQDPPITTVSLRVMGRVSGIEEDEFRNFAEQAKKDCPVSKLLTGATIELDQVTLQS